ncbi:unnamed protein product [Arctogadus glacialis]
MNATIQRALCKLVGNNPKEWDMHLDAVMFGLRTKKQMTTNFSPFYMMSGREAQYPSQIPEQYQIDSSVEDTVAKYNLTDSALNIGKILSCAEGNTKKAQEKMKRMSLKSSIQKFNVGKPQASRHHSGSIHPSVYRYSSSIHPSSHRYSTSIHPSSYRYSTSTHPSIPSHRYSTSTHPSSHRYSTSIHPSSHRYSTSIHPSIPSHRPSKMYVMNAYMHLLVRDFNVKSTDRAMAIDTFEMSNIWKRKQPKVKLDPHMYKYILGIINENHHWKLATDGMSDDDSGVQSSTTRPDPDKPEQNDIPEARPGPSQIGLQTAELC